MSRAAKRLGRVCDKIIAGGGQLTKAQQDIADFVCSWCHCPLGRLTPIERGIIEASTKADPDELYRMHDACWQAVKRLRKRRLVRKERE